MSPIEMVRTIGNCLKGSRKQAYKVEVRAARQNGRLKEHPDAVLGAIIARLQEFREGLLEKQQRLNGEWTNLSRGRKTALEFMPVFESLVSEMELAGIGKSDRDLLLRYLGLIPANHRPDVLRDRARTPTLMGPCRSRGASKRGGRPTGCS